VFLFEKLDVYRLSLKFHSKLVGLLKGKSGNGNYYLTDQLKRASLSITLNIAEGNGSYQKKDRKHFFHISRSSAFECVPLLTLCQESEMIGAKETGVLREELERISKMLSGLIKGSENRK